MDIADRPRRPWAKPATPAVRRDGSAAGPGRAAALYWTQRGLQLLDALFWMLFALIGLQFAFEFLGANDAAGFKHFIDTLTAPFLAPFGDLFADPSWGTHELKFSYLVALVIYALIQAGIRRAAALALDVHPRILDLPTRNRSPE